MPLSTLLSWLLLSHKSLPGLYLQPSLQLTIESVFWDTLWKIKSFSACYMSCYRVILRGGENQCNVWIMSGRLFKIAVSRKKDDSRVLLGTKICGICVVDGCWDDRNIQEEIKWEMWPNNSLLPFFLSLSFFHCQLLDASYGWNTMQISQN